MTGLAWVCALGGLALGGAAAFVPGFPGCAVALLGLVAFAGLTGFEILGQEALVVATLIALAGGVGQVVAPITASRAAGGTAGAATGAALGAVLGSFVPVPGFGILAAAVGAFAVGFLGTRQGVIRWLRGVVGAAGGCLVSVATDLVAVLALGAILAIADFVAGLG